jgi:hypothetical protein
VEGKRRIGMITKDGEAADHHDKRGIGIPNMALLIALLALVAKVATGERCWRLHY